MHIFIIMLAHNTCTHSNGYVEIEKVKCNINVICSALRKSSLETINICKKTSCQDYVVPGWNDYVKEAHCDARNCYTLWRNMGKPKQGPICQLMRRSRLHFKYLPKQCQQREEMVRADAMAKSLHSKDVSTFWKNVSKTYKKGVPIANVVNGANNPSSICDMWKVQFESLLNSVNSNENMKHVKDCVLNRNNFSNVHNLQITHCMVQNAIDTLKCGKSCGNDGLSAEHFKYADGCVTVLLSLFYTGAIRHGYLPGDFMKTIIIALVKNKSGDLSDVNNYRSIALVTVVSTFFENILLELMEPYLSTTDNQFGFKKGHSTDHCIYVLTNVIQYYRSYNTPVYTCFIDASKAFDRVNHWTLFKKLLNRGVPILLVRILLYWYRTQTFCIKWGTMTSCFFSVSNGVRQGGILSPYLFAIYMDDLSVTLNNAKVGCHINNRCANHMLYADDLCVIAQSPRGLQSLLDML